MNAIDKIDKIDKINKIKYINDKLDKDEFYNNIIIKIIKNNNIIYTENHNGIFVNLSKLNEIQIDLLYNNIKNDKIYDYENNRNKILKQYKIDFKNKNKDTKANKTYKKMENLLDIDLEIIEYSKTI